MLDLNITIDNEKIVINGLQNAVGVVAHGAEIGVMRVAVGIFAEAFKLLQGPARSRVSIFTGKKEYYKKTGKRKRAPMRGITNATVARPGSYPVPRITSNLLTRLAFVKPGETKTVNNYTFSAGRLEAIVFNAAEYASNIHDGTGTSEKYGARPYITDAVQNYDRGGRIVAVIEEEIQRAIDESDLG